MCSNGAPHTHAPEPQDRDQMLSQILQAMERLTTSNSALQAKVRRLVVR